MMILLGVLIHELLLICRINFLTICFGIEKVRCVAFADFCSTHQHGTPVPPRFFPIAEGPFISPPDEYRRPRRRQERREMWLQRLAQESQEVRQENPRAAEANNPGADPHSVAEGAHAVRAAGGDVEVALRGRAARVVEKEELAIMIQ